MLAEKGQGPANKFLIPFEHIIDFISPKRCFNSNKDTVFSIDKAQYNLEQYQSLVVENTSNLAMATSIEASSLKASK